MDSNEQSIRIFTGPAMIAKGLQARLNNLGIMPITRDDHQSGISSGFAMGVPDQVQLFIRPNELAIAKDSINDYFKEIGEPSI
ncbi:hypothetical protein [Patiriisocius sp. Uisw_017]|jgi:hypothetical protein|uniref:hypothetical protein n=1 Tax=Patiriisocius sp. Uisw_017 TaxID=3230968 RepID=UPI0039E9A794